MEDIGSMSTPEELKETYAFIGAFLSETVLEPYGSNALPLFSVGLHLGVEDLASFAGDSLTDSPNDKKADIYINEAEGLACIAQGTTAEKWGKAEAPANKASDLNTAAAWLLRTPIDKIPGLCLAGRGEDPRLKTAGLVRPCRQAGYGRGSGRAPA